MDRSRLNKIKTLFRKCHLVGLQLEKGSEEYNAQENMATDSVERDERMPEVEKKAQYRKFWISVINISF